MKNVTSTAFNFDPKNGSIETQFKVQLRQFSLFAKRFGYNIEPYRPETWIKFGSLTSAVQLDAFKKFMQYASLCMSASSEISFDDDRSMIWWAVKSFGMRPSSDFFDKLTSEDVVEIYNTEGLQIFRNWAFFEISSYSMGDLFIYPWEELYIRDSKIVSQMLAHTAKILTGEVRHTLPVTVDRHLLTEALSSNRNVLDMQLKYISPLFGQNDAIVGFFSVSSVTRIGQVEKAPTPAAASGRSSHLSLVE